MAGVVSLERALSKRRLASRTEARALILAGRVRVDGRVARNPARRVTPEIITIDIDGAPAAAPSPARGRTRVIALHKPRGTVTTKRDPEGRPTVFDVLGEAGRGLVAVGRLDRASTGLLLFTNDTRLADALTDPANRHVRRYVVTVRGRVEDASVARLSAGIDVPGARGQVERLRPSAIARQKTSARETRLIVELTEGRNREVRRLFEAIGHEVTRLHRVSFAGVALGELAPGRWRDVDVARELTTGVVSMLKYKT